VQCELDLRILLACLAKSPLLSDLNRKCTCLLPIITACAFALLPVFHPKGLDTVFLPASYPFARRAFPQREFRNRSSCITGKNRKKPLAESPGSKWLFGTGVGLVSAQSHYFVQLYVIASMRCCRLFPSLFLAWQCFLSVSTDQPLYEIYHIFSKVQYSTLKFTLALLLSVIFPYI
jgi:hypothetical protein